MKKAWLIPLILVPAVLAPIAFGGCEVTIRCEDGACSSSAIATGAGGGATCIDIPSDPDTHGFPPDVYAVLKKNCHKCHVPNPEAMPGGPCCFGGAPQPFLFYEQTQAPYYTTELKWWSQMREHAVLNKPTSMPFDLPPIPDCQKAILTAWFDTCGLDTDADKCTKGMGSMGTTTSTSTSSSASSSSSTGSASSSSTGP